MNQRTLSNLRKAEAVGVAICLTAVFAADVFARVGGGGSYGGGGGHGGGGGGAGALIYLLIRFLLWLTIEHPVIGIPVDIIVIGLVIYWFTRPSKKTIAATSSSILGVSGAAAAPARQPGFQREFNQLRRFDPNFSEIIFTDFCYALYGRAHEARGQGPKAPRAFAHARTSDGASLSALRRSLAERHGRRLRLLRNEDRQRRISMVCPRYNHAEP